MKLVLKDNQLGVCRHNVHKALKRGRWPTAEESADQGTLGLTFMAVALCYHP